MIIDYTFLILWPNINCGAHPHVNLPFSNLKMVGVEGAGFMVLSSLFVTRHVCGNDYFIFQLACQIALPFILNFNVCLYL